MMRSKIILLFLFSILFLSCNSQPSDAVEILAPKEFAQRLQQTPNAQLIDVRTPKEFASENIDSSVNINWNDAAFESQAAKLDKSQPVFVYCKVGGRSANAAEKLQEMGFTKIYDLQGGILKWNSAGLSKADEKRIGITESEYKNITSGSNKVLVNFSAEWCAPCKKMKPYLLKMQQELKDDVQIIRLDADANKSVMEEMKIDELPALLLYENGKLTWQHNGFIAEDDLKKQLL